MENDQIRKIKHSCQVIQEMATHSKSMSIGAKAIIKTHTTNILKELETIELEMMARK